MNKIHTFTPLLYSFLKNLVAPWFHANYPVKLTNPEILKEMQPPYILLPNHMMKWDMVLLGLKIKDPVHYMAADSHFRKNPGRFCMKALGAFPKAKAKSDLGAIKHMMALKEKHKAICIYPEGQMSWDGGPLPLYYSTAKLLKLLKIPVFVPIHNGAYAAQPRWAKSRRKGPIELTIHPLFPDGSALKKISPDEIYEKLTDLIKTDEYSLLKERNWEYKSSESAEYLENLLFLCPECREIATLTSRGSTISCRSCGFSQTLSSQYTFSNNDLSPGRFPTPREWNAWQRSTLKELLDNYRQKETEASFMEDTDMTIRVADKKGTPREWTRNGKIALQKEHLILSAEEGRKELLLKELSGINIMTRQRLELYHNETFYVFDFPDLRDSGYKWLCALRTLGLPSSYAWPGEEIEKF